MKSAKPTARRAFSAARARSATLKTFTGALLVSIPIFAPAGAGLEPPGSSACHAEMYTSGAGDYLLPEAAHHRAVSGRQRYLYPAIHCGKHSCDYAASLLISLVRPVNGTQACAVALPKAAPPYRLSRLEAVSSFARSLATCSACASAHHAAWQLT